ncbi:hypothetical protein KSP40_PGU015544 [Platanthera guangdongensis]|uniref:Uncharacterized protein n=1 Tax=Platanthera guangdongensis TaxID=2320717 RepID=A0ABR2LT94_9ASPA
MLEEALAKVDTGSFNCSSKRLIEMARKWKKIAVFGRKRISSGTRTVVASRGHVFVYSADNRRFIIPLTYLSSDIFRELLRMSEEEFGLPTNGPVTLPFDASFLEYLLSLLKFPIPMEVERAALISISNCRYNSRVSALVAMRIIKILKGTSNNLENK